MATATTGTITYRRMQALAKSDPALADRLKLFDHRVPEELYNYAVDPNALNNLVNVAEYRQEYERLTGELEKWMERTNDPMLEVFRQRADLNARELYMAQVVEEAKERNKLRPEKKNAKKNTNGKRAGKKKSAIDPSAKE
jgi:N-sulfoglucosamine sulfohydrolase